MNTQTKRAACVLLFINGNILAVSRGPTRLDWGLPGGKVEPGETDEQGARRELLEETGVAVDAPLVVVMAAQSGDYWCTTYAPAAAPALLTRPRQPSPFEGFVSWVAPETLLSANCTFADYNRLLFKKVGLVP